MKPSMVAMLGLIMPAPLAMPVMVMVSPSSSMRRLATLGTVSVVMMPSAARPQWCSLRSSRASGRPSSNGSMGKVWPITPVENGSTSEGAQCASSDSSRQVSSQ